MGNTCPLSQKKTAMVEPLQLVELQKDGTIKQTENETSSCVTKIKSILKPTLVEDHFQQTPIPEEPRTEMNSSYRPEDNIRILLLGTSDSGKTTLGRQIRTLYGTPFSDKEILQFKHLIRESCLEDLSNTFVEYMALYNPSPTWIRDCVLFLKKMRNRIVDRSLMNLSVRLWKDLDFQYYLCSLNLTMKLKVKESMEVAILDDAHKEGKINPYQPDAPAYHLLPKLEDIMAHGYEPTHEDILSLRITTSGIVETILHKGILRISLVDVGGQRSERKKWIHCFDDVNAVLFLVAMSEYDEKLKEDGKTNRMHESIKLFASVANNKWFLKPSLLLFLNKKDVFDQKIKHSSLSKCFSDYRDEELLDTTPEDFLAEKFVAEVNDGRSIYRHYTCARDRQNIKVVFQVTIDLIKQKNMRYCGMC